MNYRYIADTYAWLAYFNKKCFQNIIDNELVETPTIVIAEITRTLHKREFDEEKITKAISFISGRGLILPLDSEHAIAGGNISASNKLPLIDGIIYSYLETDDCRLLTGDEHFKGMKNIIFQKE